MEFATLFPTCVGRPWPRSNNNGFHFFFYVFRETNNERGLGPGEQRGCARLGVCSCDRWVGRKDSLEMQVLQQRLGSGGSRVMGHFLGLESLVRARASTGLTSALGRDVQASEGSPGKVAEKGERGQTLQTSEEEAQEYVVGSQGFAGRGGRRSCGGGSANSG